MSILQWFKKSNNSNIKLDFSSVSTDMHSHLIPGIDDGCKTIEESISIIKELSALGFKKLICTPHIMHDFYKNNKQTIENALRPLKEAILKENINIKIDYAAEYLLDDGFCKIIENNQLLTLGDNYVLIEFPNFQLPQNYLNVFFDLQISGYKIILAHPERYNFWQNDFAKYEDLKNRNIYFQLNTVSLTGYYSPIVKTLAEKLINANMIDFIGTDMHNHYYLNALMHSQNEKYLHKIINSNKLLNNTI